MSDVSFRECRTGYDGQAQAARKEPALEWQQFARLRVRGSAANNLRLSGDAESPCFEDYMTRVI
ncbi:MAG: hypothetical protein FJ276_13150 [Planctomycetes bacterium]|nr:hypothetical protein [Planctomycetota bacterium]